MASVVCKNCNKTFTTEHSRKIYCSKKCGSKSRNNTYNSRNFIMGSNGIKGAHSELLVCADLLRKGFQVFRNVTPNGIDLVAYKNNRFLGVEVKSSFTCKNGRIQRSYLSENQKNTEIIAYVNDNIIEYVTNIEGFE